MAGLFRSGPSFNLTLLLALVVVLYLAGPADAFGAGNIASASKIEGTNWRHGDIEDVLVDMLITRGRKFSKLDVKRVYFGNWLRDYSQAVDVGTVKYVSAEAVRLLLWVLGFMSFGFATREFEVTKERLGCYRPEEHIDNPKDYADNEDARRYDPRLRAPVDERRELSVDRRTGLKNYIASEDQGITTSAGHVRNLFRRAIDLGRRSRNKNDEDFFEALRLLGTALHCLEDYSAHSNYVELALIELGERDVFPHVGRNTQLQVDGARNRIWPLVTGTFGGVDFLHSVCGEVTDKVTQSEIQELEGAFNGAQQSQNISKIKELLDKIPPGILGGEDKKQKVDEIHANTAAGQMAAMNISPKEPEAFTLQAQELTRQIYPVLEFHDEIMRSITEALSKIPGLEDLAEQLQEAISMYCFSLLAPFILPVIGQIKSEMETGSTEIIQSSRDKQHIVFNDGDSSDPTHSMLSKDHFTNILNEPAGKVASAVLKWVVPQIVDAWDHDNVDVERTIDRIVGGVFHHPALRDYGSEDIKQGRNTLFAVVEGWWRQKSSREQADFRQKLSREGVLNGRNHKEGVHDTGHGCGKPLGFAHVNSFGLGKDPLTGAIVGGINQALGGGNQSGGYGGGSQSSLVSGVSNQAGKLAGEAVGGGAFGNVLGGLVGGIGGALLGGALENKQESSSSGYNPDGSYTQAVHQSGNRPSGHGQSGGYGQAEYSRTDYPSGGRREEVKRYEETSGGYGRQESRIESRTDAYGNTSTYQSSTTYQGRDTTGGARRDSGDEDDYAKKERKRREKEEKEQRKAYEKDNSDDDDKYKRKEYGGGRKRDSGDDDKYRKRSNSRERYGGGQQQSGYGGQQSGYGGQQQGGYGGQQSGGYGGRQEGGYGAQQGGGYGGQQGGYGGRQEGGYGQQEGGYGRRDDDHGGRRRDDDDNNYGRRRNDKDDDSDDEKRERRRRQEQGGYGRNY